MAVKFKDTININDSYTLPTGDGTTGQVMTTDGSGNITFGDPGGDGEVVKIECKNTSGSTITKGTPVYISGTVGSSFRIEVAPADASNVAKMPAVGVLETDLVNNGQGYVVTGGILKNLITTPIGLDYTSVNDTLYVAVGGGLSAQPPSGANYIQNIGKVARVSTTASGSIVVSSILRTNQVPAPLFVNVANQKVGIKPNGYHSPSVSLDISATDAVQMPAGTTVQRPTGANGMFRYNSTDNQFEGYADGAWGAIAGGGGGATAARATYSPNGSTLAFAIGQSISDENNVFVYIDGVYQEKSTFSVSGSTLTFGTGNEPPNGTTLEIISYASAPAVVEIGQVQNNTFSGDGTTTTFTLSIAPTNEAHTLVYINGVYQEKSTYSVSGSTLTLSEAPDTGDSIEVESRKTLLPTGLTFSNLDSDLFTATAAQTSFTLVNGTPANKSQTLVYINGVYQNKSTYSLTSGAIVLSTGADAGDEVEVVSMEGLTSPNVAVADDSVSTAKLQDNSVTSDKVGSEFKTSSSLTAAATIDVDYTSAQIFTLTPNASTTLNITNPIIGVSKSVIVTGAGGSYTLTFNVGGVAGTFNKISGDYDDTASTKNFIQLTCVSTTEFWYSISQIAT
jgi:hypothetical protein